MKRSEIFKTLINLLNSDTIRYNMEFKSHKAYSEITEGLKNTGLVLLGIGMYSVVVEHKEHPGRVFKISTSRVDGYRAYAKYCMEHVGEPLIPTVYSAVEDGDLSWYEIEKYYSCTLPVLSSAGTVQYPSDKVHDIINMIQHASYSTDMTEYQLKHNTRTRAMRKPKRDQYLNELREYIKNARSIYDTFKDSYRLDVHLGNIMLTADNQVIITDPLANDLCHEVVNSFSY